jgi:hypothetical protein
MTHDIPASYKDGVNKKVRAATKAVILLPRVLVPHMLDSTVIDDSFYFD